MPYDPYDLDSIIRTVYGEAGLEPALGQKAVASIILNRAKRSGKRPADIVREPNQFEGFNARAQRLSPGAPIYKRIQQIISPLINGEEDDPTGGADHFYSPTAQAALGRPTPDWAKGPYQDIGRHRFYALGYGQDQPDQFAGAQPPTPADTGPTGQNIGQDFLQGQLGMQQPQPSRLGPQEMDMAQDGPQQPQQSQQPAESPSFLDRLSGAGFGPAMMRLGAGLAAGASKGWGAGLGLGFAGAADALQQNEENRLAEGALRLKQAGPAAAYKALMQTGQYSKEEALNYALNPEMLPKWNTEVVGESVGGNKIYKQTNQYGQTRDVPGAAANVDAGADLSGPELLDYIKKTDPNEGAFISKMLNYEADPNDISKRGNKKAEAIGLATRIDGNFNPANYSNIYEARKAFRGTKQGTPGFVLRGMDQAAQHFGSMMQAFDDINKQGSGPMDSGPDASWSNYLLNKPYNWARIKQLEATGNPAVKGAMPAILAQATEIAKFFKGAGVLNEKEVDEWLSTVQAANSPQEQAAVAHRTIDLFNHAAQSWKNQYDTIVGPAVAEKYPMPFQFSPDSLKVFKRLHIQPLAGAPEGFDAGAPEAGAYSGTGDKAQAEVSDVPANLPDEWKQLWPHMSEQDRATVLQKLGVQ